MRLAIIGAGGHGHDIAAIAEACGHIVYLFDDDPDSGAPSPGDVPCDEVMVAVNDSRSRERRSRDVRRQPTIVHPSASVCLDWHHGHGCVVAQNVTIGPSVVMGDGVHVNGGVFITRAHVGAYTTIGPNATICGDVVIGERVMIGAGAVISNLVTIPSGTVIGAGAVVPPGRVLSSGTWVGNPVRCV